MDEHLKHGYEFVYSPHIGKANLWETSGHLTWYEDLMYSPLDIDDESYLLVEQIGDYILMKKAEVRMKEINRILGSEAKKKGITRKDLLRALKAAQKETWAE